MSPSADQHPLLAMWRSGARVEFVKRMHLLLPLLAELTVLPREADRRLVVEALEPAPGQAARIWLVALRLAHRRPDENDLVMSWTALAAALGSAPACLAVLSVLGSYAYSRAPRRAFISWLRVARDEMPDVFSEVGRAAWVNEFTREPAPSQNALSVEPQPEGERKEQSAGLAGKTTLRVIKDPLNTNWGDLNFSQDRYVPLTEPLPLKASAHRSGEITHALQAEFPWMTGVVSMVESDLVLGEELGRSWLRLQALLIVGPPGCGKTRLCRRVAELCDVPHMTLLAGGSSDNRMLQGTAAGYTSAQPSVVLKMIADHRCPNPIIIVDEIDKASPRRHNGSVLDTLLSLLEPETAKAWMDECLVARADVSQVSWLLTANSTESLPPALLSRVATVHVDPPASGNFGPIFRRILKDFAAEYGVDVRLMPQLDHTTVRALRRRFADTRSIRDLRRALRRCLVSAARRPRPPTS